MLESLGLVVLLAVITILYKIHSNKTNSKKRLNRTRLQKIQKWMEMSAQERRADDEAEKLASMRKRKALLSTIRKEYKSIKSTN